MTTPRTSWESWIDTEKKRMEAMGVLQNAALPFAIGLKRDKRTGKQNKRQWAMLAKVAKQHMWFGQWLSKEDWKLIFLQSLHSEMRMVPNLNNDGFIALGRSSSNLTVSEHSDLTALIEHFAAKHNIDLGDTPNQKDAA